VYDVYDVHGGDVHDGNGGSGRWLGTRGLIFGNQGVPKTNLDKNDLFYRKTEYIPEYGERNESH